ncbi:hypothetical protein [Limnoglobus roseus]|uniref:Uncharacterized protein n=1 Tax=Limnoglobus roseus TaxID=2598579 RepID=A0A5C1AA45_9BACT|nr:hypothetical protein [Limnoglobus roseus]QEL13994.1 hypothetical protein PX52LOC_00855 [Limnoglobus roseus]
MRTLLLLALLAAPAFANEKPIAYPVPAEFPSPNKEFVFVLIPPKSDDPSRKENSIQAALRQKYAASGLYRADDATKPLWTVDWYDYEAHPANDGVHVVRIHGENDQWRHYPNARKLPDETIEEQLAAPAVSFYANGQLLRTYSVRELIARPDDLPNTMRFILWNAGGVLSQDGKQFVLMTQDSRQNFFDLATGRLVEGRDAGLGNAKVWVIRISLGLVGTAVIVVMSLYLYHLRKK